jgi:hypothetical protein
LKLGLKIKIQNPKLKGRSKLQERKRPVSVSSAPPSTGAGRAVVFEADIEARPWTRSAGNCEPTHIGCYEGVAERYALLNLELGCFLGLGILSFGFSASLDFWFLNFEFPTALLSLLTVRDRGGDCFTAGAMSSIMTTTVFRWLTVGIFGVACTVSADVLELKNGTVLNGTYSGGNASAINFQTSAGMQVINISQTAALTFTGRNAAAAPAAAAAAAPAAGGSVTLPAGTTLLVRLMDPVSSQNAAGTKFTTRLEYDLMAGNAVAVKAGTTIYGQVASSTQARRAIGKSTLDLRLAQISAGGTPVPILTSGHKQAGEESIRKAARGAAAGAAIGAIAGDAGKGAAIGATAGCVE